MFSCTASPVADSRCTWPVIRQHDSSPASCPCIGNSQLHSRRITYHQLLLQMVPIIVILPRIDIPTPKAIPIHSEEVLITRPRCKIILGDVPITIRLQPGLILNLVLRKVFTQWRQFFVLHIRSAFGESRIVQAPESAEFSQHGQRMIHKVLIGTRQTREYHPVHIAFGCGEDDIDVFLAPVCPFFGNGGRGPIQIGRCAICSSVTGC